MKINIAGIPKEEIVIALFNNVYKKSKASYQTWMRMGDAYLTTAAPIGTDYAPTEDQVKAILAERGGYVDYIGAVGFKINFSGTEIDVTFYDTEHGTGTDAIKTAEACVASVKAGYQARVAEKARVAALLEQVTRSFADHLGVDHSKISCIDNHSNTIVSVDVSFPGIRFTLPEKISAIAEILIGSERMTYLDGAKAQYDAIVAERARAAAALALVTNALKEHFGLTNLRVNYHEHSPDTVVSVGEVWNAISFKLPEKISVIADILAGSERRAYLDRAKAQYDAIVTEKARVTASVELVTSVLKDHLGVEHLKVFSQEDLADTTVSVGESYPTTNFSISGKVSAIAEILSSSERMTFLVKVKAQYEAMAAGKPRGVSSSGAGIFGTKSAGSSTDTVVPYDLRKGLSKS